MNKKKYIAPSARSFEIKTEGVIAESLQIGTTPGGEQLTSGKIMDAEDWGNNSEKYWETEW